jgi:transcriptional regulator with XRE-family HTH domain
MTMSQDLQTAGASAHRIRIARRSAGLSQAQLALELGVQRSAVSHWEAQRGKPSMNNLRALALLTGVQFEWLATGRGPMTPSAESLLDSVAAVDALLVDDPQERRLLNAFRDAPMAARLPLLELAEQLASHRTGRRSRGGLGGGFEGA